MLTIMLELFPPCYKEGSSTLFVNTFFFTFDLIQATVLRSLLFPKWFPISLSTFRTISFVKMSHPDVNRCMLIFFLRLFDMADSKRRLNVLKLTVSDAIMWVGKAAVQASQNIMSQVEKKVSRQKSELKESLLSISDSLALCELETEQINQVSRVPLLSHLFVLKDSLDWEFFFKCPAILITRPLYLTVHNSHRMSSRENSPTNVDLPYEKSVPNALETHLYFHSEFYSVDKYHKRDWASCEILETVRIQEWSSRCCGMFGIVLHSRAHLDTCASLFSCICGSRIISYWFEFYCSRRTGPHHYE